MNRIEQALKKALKDREVLQSDVSEKQHDIQVLQGVQRKKIDEYMQTLKEAQMELSAAEVRHRAALESALAKIQKSQQERLLKEGEIIALQNLKSDETGGD